MSKNKIIIILLSFCLSIVSVLPANAALIGDTSKASLSVSPQSGKFNVNDTFKVNIYVNTGGQNINVVSAILKFDKNHFQALNIDSSGSVFNMIAETGIDQNTGKIRITLGIPTPDLSSGVNTSNGLVAAVTFKALSNVTAVSDNLIFDFASGNSDLSAVFLNDKKGTNILTGVSGGQYTIGEGGPVSYIDGTLLKVVGGTKVYVIDGGQKRWIPTAEIFNSNGYKWADIIEVAQSVLDSISIGPDMTGPVVIPEGGLIRANGDVDVYIVKYIGAKKFKRLILSPSVFNSYKHLKWSDVKIVDQATSNSFVTSNLVRAINDTKVYELFPSGDTGQKQWIKTQDAFSRLGFDWDSVYQINQVDRDSYTEGAPIE